MIKKGLVICCCSSEFIIINTEMCIAMPVNHQNACIHVMYWYKFILHKSLGFLQLRLKASSPASLWYDTCIKSTDWNMYEQRATYSQWDEYKLLAWSYTFTYLSLSPLFPQVILRCIWVAPVAGIRSLPVTNMSSLRCFWASIAFIILQKFLLIKPS